MKNELIRTVCQICRRSNNQASAGHIGVLFTIGGSLRRLAELACNGELVVKQVERQRRMEKQAKALAESFGATVYFQRDPRGCMLWLIFPGYFYKIEAN